MNNDSVLDANDAPAPPARWSRMAMASLVLSVLPVGSVLAPLLGLVALQGAVAGVLGLGLGLGVTAVVGLSIPGDKLAFKMTWQIPVISAGAVVFIVVASSLLSMRRVVKLDPSEVFQG